MHRLGRSYGQIALIVLNTLVLLILIEGFAGILLTTRQTPLEADFEAFRKRMLALSYYRTQVWADAYWKEHLQADRWGYQPYRLWQTRPYTGQYINITTNGNRYVPASDCEGQKYRIYVFGGSTMWGYGVPDWNTIPSEMQSILFDDAVCVVNFAELGYSSTQNLLRLSQVLSQGDIPNMVIFYDGANDVTAAHRNSIAGGHFYYETIHQVVNSDAFAPSVLSFIETQLNVFRQSATYRLIIGFPPKIQPRWALPPLDEAFIQQTTQTYLDNLTMAHALAQAYGVLFVAFIQPVLPVSSRRVTLEEQTFLWDMPGGLNDLFLAVYPRWQTEAQQRDYLVYLGNALDDQTETVWIDFNHLTPTGNLVIATKIVATIRPLLNS